MQLQVVSKEEKLACKTTPALQSMLIDMLWRLLWQQTEYLQQQGFSVCHWDISRCRATVTTKTLLA